MGLDPEMCSYRRLLLLAILLSFGNPALSQQEKQATPAEPNAVAELAYNKGQFAEVLKITEKQIKKDPKDHVALYLSASALVEIGRRTGNAGGVRQGIDDARKAIEISKGATSRHFLPYLYGMTTLTELEGDPRHAKQGLESATKVLAKETVSENKAHLYYHRARIHSVLEEHAKAQADFQEAIRRDEKFLAARMGLADSFASADNMKRARETFDEAVRKFPNNPIVINNRGLFLQDAQELELAVVDFTSAIQLNPRFVAAYTNRGYTLLAMDDPEAAELDFTASLGLVPQQPMVLRLRAGCRLLQKQPTTAIEDLVASSQLRADAAVYIDLGFAKLMNRDYKDSGEILKKVQEMDPSLQHIRPWRFASLLGTKQKEAAVKEYAADLARVKANAKDAAWNDWLCGLMAEVIDAQKLMQVASSDPEKRTGRTTEANFFLGLQAELKSNTAAASKYYKQALAGDRKDLAAYRAALVGLDRTMKK